MSNVIELYYQPAQLAAALGGRSTRWVLEEIRKGSFGPNVIEDGGDYLVPASGVNAFLERRRIFSPQGELKPIYARSADHAKRRAALLRGAATASPDV